MRTLSNTIRTVDWLGVGGVHPSENNYAITVDKWLRWPLFLLVFWLPAQWHLVDIGVLPTTTANHLSVFIWLSFLAETVLLTSLVTDKKRYLFSNWTNLIIIISALPALWHHTPISGVLRLLRLIIIPRLIITWWIQH